MSSVSKLQKKIYDLTSGLFATWLPDDRLDIGDYGKLEKGRFLRDGNLRKKGISFEEETISSDSSAFRYSDGAKIKAGASGTGSESLGGGEVAGEIEFSKEGGFIYHFHDAKQVRVESRDDFLRALLQAATTGQIKWQDGYVVIDELRDCARYWIMVSDRKSGSVRLKGSAKILEGSNLASVGGNLSPSVEFGSIIDYSNGKQGRPLYHAIKPIFGGDPTGGGGGGGGFKVMQRYFWNLFGRRHPEPDEIDIVSYQGTPGTFMIRAKDTRPDSRRFFIRFEAATIDDLLGDSDLPNLSADTSSVEEAFRTQTALGEKMSRVALQAAERSTEISAQWAKDTIVRMGELAAAKDQPAEYAKALSAFAAAAAELATEHMAAYAEVAKKVQMDTVDLILTAGKDIAEDAQGAAQNTTGSPEEATQQATEAVGRATRPGTPYA